mgnify:CR=1 FL=1
MEEINIQELITEARMLHSGWMAFESMNYGGGQGAKSDDGEASKKFMWWLVDDFPELCNALERAERDLGYLRSAIKDKGGNEHYPTEDAYLRACDALQKEHAENERLHNLLAERNVLLDKYEIEGRRLAQDILNLTNAYSLLRQNNDRGVSKQERQ